MEKLPTPISLDKARRKKRGEVPTPYPTKGPTSGLQTQADINLELVNSISDMATYCEQLSDYVETLESRVEATENHMRLLLKGLREYFGTKAERDLLGKK